jgi:hypothetical protein
MRISILLCTVLIATIAGMPGALAGSAAGITKHDTEELSDNALAHLAMDSLADSLGSGVNAPFGPTAPLGGYNFVTRPRLAFVGGVCQSDQIQLELRSVDPKASGSLAPMQVVGVDDVKHLFLVIRPSTQKPIVADTVGYGTDNWIAQVAECASHSTKERFFEAPGPYEASRAAAVLLRAIDAAKAKNPLAIACDQEQPDCSERLAQTSLSAAYEVSPCSDSVRREPECWSWSTFRGYFRIQADTDYKLTEIHEIVPPKSPIVTNTR